MKDMAKKNQQLAKKSPKKTQINLEAMLEWYRLAYTAQQIDERAQRYIRRGMGWSYHAKCNGHEGIQIAVGQTFRPKVDYLFPYYRDTATVLSAGISAKEIFQNGLSKASDVGSGGRHMSNHFAKPEIHIENVSSCTGNHTLHAVGVARAIKYYGEKAFSISSQGDSSVSEGYCYEAFNGASREKLPVIFVIQNNGYGISVPSTEQTANKIISDNFSGLKNLLIINVDGTDFIESSLAMNEAKDYVLSGKGPAMVHAQCIRIGAHSNSDAHELYRSKVEIEEAKKQDPVLKLRNDLLKLKQSESSLESLEKNIVAKLDEDAAEVEKESGPDKNSNKNYVYGLEYKSKILEADAVATNPEPTEKLREAINRTLTEEFEKNEHAFLWGQDCASKKKGGVFNLTKGLLEKFGPKRIFNGPIAEDFIVGTANGMSRYKKEIRIVVEAAQFADYVWPAMEQIVEMGHDYWRSNGQFCPNIVLRLASGGYINGGLYHSQNVEAIMSHLPGIRVVYPSFAEDAAGLLRTAIRSNGPTFFLEPKYLYNRPDAKGPMFDSEFSIPFGSAKIRRAGEDLSVVTYGNTTHMVLNAANQLSEMGIDVEVVDLRSIKPIDKDAICKTIRKTGKLLVIQEDHLFSSIAGEIISIAMENCFMDLDAPIKRLGAKDIPVGFAKSLESETLPQVNDIKNAIIDLAEY
jgi:2-oxoisovalerate dehydrogenase E1 component